MLIYYSLCVDCPVKICNIKYFSLFFCQAFKVVDEALIAETGVWCVVFFYRNSVYIFM